MYIYHINTCRLYTKVGPYSSDIIIYRHLYTVYKTEVGKALKNIKAFMKDCTKFGHFLMQVLNKLGKVYGSNSYKINVYASNIVST